jgi:phage terminase large subunit
LSTQPVEAVADFPRKLRCLFDPARYKILYGGRGGAKSWGIARALLILGARNKLRIACGREVQKSIAQSVHHLLKTQIEALGLQAAYRIFDSQIVGTNGTLITFHGLKTNIDSVKSLEGIDIFWVEEAQTVSKTSWDVLIPTIRKDGSEIWVSFNPELDTDETYVRFVLSPPAGAIVVKINWRDNPWFNAVLQAELEATRARSEDDYLHTWEGNTRQVLDGAIYANEIRAAVADNRFTRVPYDEAKPVETFWDLGRADNTSIWFAQCVGFEFRVIDFYESNGHHLTHYLKVLRERPYLYGDLWLPHDAQAKTVGMERTIEQQARDAGFSVRIAPKSGIAEGINAARTIFGRCWFDQEKCADGLNHLRRYRYEVDPDTRQWSRNPLHDEHSHAADAFRYLAMSLRSPVKSRPINYGRALAPA